MSELLYNRAVIDARLGFTIVQSLVIKLGFMTKDALKEWATMKLLNIQNIEEQVKAMTCEKIGSNFELIPPSWLGTKMAANFFFLAIFEQSWRSLRCIRGLYASD